MTKSIEIKIQHRFQSHKEVVRTYFVNEYNHFIKTVDQHNGFFHRNHDCEIELSNVKIEKHKNK